MSFEYEKPGSENSESPNRVAEPSVYQLDLGIDQAKIARPMAGSYRDALVELLADDLDFHSQDTGYASHNMHAFPAKFPPQLPHKFILALTVPGDVVLDPMMGSGTTIVEAILNDRKAIGYDIDPLARLITLSKTTPLDPELAFEMGRQVLSEASDSVLNRREQILDRIDSQFDPQTRKFQDYWFAEETQIELMALAAEIEKVSHGPIRSFLELTFSACIITKSGGVSLAFDLAHTRPHRAKVVLSATGEVILGEENAGSENPRIQFLTKRLKPAIPEFHKRLQQNVASLGELRPDIKTPILREGNAQKLDLPSNSIDLIVTSPPYASNAIDYMRAHKFSLVWLGYPVSDLGDTRKKYIGGESVQEFDFENLPLHTLRVISDISKVDAKKGKVLHRYYSEMKRVLQEMVRVLRPGKASIVVVASSVMRDIDTETDRCLAEIGESVGFEVPRIGMRTLDRNKRMLPASFTVDRDSQIQQRMHQEFVIGFYKPSR